MRVIEETGRSLGTLQRAEAIALSAARGLILVEVSLANSSACVRAMNLQKRATVAFARLIVSVAR